MFGCGACVGVFDIIVHFPYSNWAEVRVGRNWGAEEVVEDKGECNITKTM